MKRRDVLAAIGVGTASLAGWLESGVAGLRDGSTPPVPDSTPPVNTGGLDEFDPEDTFRKIDLGSRDGVSDDFRPHDVAVWNATTDQLDLNFRVLDRLADETTHQETYPIPADEELYVSLLKPSKYYIQLWGPAITSAETLLVPCNQFDCNSSGTNIGVFENGEVRSSVHTTLLGCSGFEC